MKLSPRVYATDRAECLAYFALGAAALAALLLATPLSIRFGNSIDPVTANLRRGGAGVVPMLAGAGGPAPTNLAQGSVSLSPPDAPASAPPAPAAPITPGGARRAI